MSIIDANFRLSRRGFLASCGALGVAVQFGAIAEAAELLAFTPNAWVTIGTDETVTIMFALAEMGQGIMTGLPLLVAEEMDADWSKVRVVQSPSDAGTYGVNGKLGTFGSSSTHDYYDRLREVGALTRRILMQTAADRWKLPLAALSTGPGMVRHEPSRRKLTYGALARTARVPDPLPQITPADLKPASQFRYIGRSLPRVDLASKVNGTARFGIDTELPGMLYGAILRPPVQGEAPIDIDDKAARAIAGVVAIKPLAHGVAIIADTVEATHAAKAALRVTWSNGAKARSYTSATALADYRTVAEAPATVAAPFEPQGDVAAALAGAATRLVRYFTADHAAHLCMEPMNATALVGDATVEIWVPTQSPTNIKHAIAAAASIAEDKVVVHTTLLGGGFGRRFEGAVGRDAYLVAREMPGRPVKLIWTREDDLLDDPYRPLAVQRIEAGLDTSGNLAAWRHRTVAASYMARTAPPTLQRLGGFDPLVAYTGTLPYPAAASVAEYVQQDRGIDVGALRGISLGYTVFATECMIDEIASALKLDPLAFRLSRLKDNPRAAAVVQKAAQMAKWDDKRTDRGLGIAYSNDIRSHVAMVAEISVDKASGTIRVHAIWCAADIGIVVQPRTVVAQIEGGIVLALGLALFEQVNIVDGAPKEQNFGDYRVPRMSDLPDIEIELIPSESPVGGVGEAGVPPTAPAIANAFAQLTVGKRLRQLPMLPERVAQALKDETSA